MKYKDKIVVSGDPKYFFDSFTVYYSNGENHTFKVGKKGSYIQMNPPKKWWQFWR